MTIAALSMAMSSNGNTTAQSSPQTPSLQEIRKNWYPVNYERGWFQEQTPLSWPPRSQRRKPAMPRRVQGLALAAQAAQSGREALNGLLNAAVVSSAMLKPLRLVVELTTRKAFDEALQYFGSSARSCAEHDAVDQAAQDASKLAVSMSALAGASDRESGAGATSDLESFLQQSDREERVRRRASAAFVRRKKRKKVLRSRSSKRRN